MKAIIIMIFTLLTFSCATQKQHVKAVNGITEISFGKSGGFTGMTEEYLLTGKAELFKVSGGEEIKLNRIAKKEIRSITKQISELQFRDVKLAETGNMTYFIEVRAKDYTNRVTWSDMSDAPHIKELYKILVTTLTTQ